MGQADAILCSPPYADSVNGGHHGIDPTKGVHAALRPQSSRHNREQLQSYTTYGTAEGQVGALKSGPCPGGEADVGDVKTLTWAGCYGTQWGPLLCPAAMSHPAKFSYNLLTRLYDHGFERGWWAKGSVVVDPFGGVGCGGVVAAYRGLRWVGCELEFRFVALAEETFAMHRGKWRAAGDTPPVILQGDSRNFAAVVACVTSPTWVDPRERPPQDPQGDSRQFVAPAAGAAACVTSPPYASQVVNQSARSMDGLRDVPITAEQHWGRTGPAQGHYLDVYGTTPGQLGALKEGDADSVVTSPPWVDPRALSPRGNAAWVASGRLPAEGSGPGTDLNAYGVTEGQVGGLPQGDADSVITSPPYAASVHGRNGIDLAKCDRPGAHTQAGAQGYGATPGNVGNLRSGPLAFCAACGRMIPDTQRPRSDHVDPTEPETGGPGDAMSQSAALGIPSSGAACAEEPPCGPVANAGRSSGPKRNVSGAGPVTSRPSTATSPPQGSASTAERHLPPTLTPNVACPAPTGERTGTPKSGGAAPLPDATSLSPPSTPSGITDGPVETKGGAVSPGGDKNALPGSATATGVSSAARFPASTSTTSRTKRRRAGSGTTRSKTSVPSAESATPRPTTSAGTAPTRLCAACAAGSSLPVPSTRASVPLTAAAPATAKETVPGGHDEYLGNLAAGDAGAVVTSPPYAEGCAQTGGADLHPAHIRGGQRGVVLRDYGTAPGQVGALRQETYWDAVRCIYGQCLLALKPGGVACVVIKDFVRAKKRVPLCDQTWRLLLSLGFTPVERIRCLLSEETREPSLFGGEEVRRKSRESFFRRLSRKRGAPEIPWEEILVVRRPPAGEG